MENKLEPLPQESKILEAFLNKADLKQNIYSNTSNAFDLIKAELKLASEWIQEYILRKEVNVNIHYQDHGQYETEMKFAGDTLFFIMHSNVFTFQPEHFIFNTEYVKKDPSRAYCGMILIYNFLSDSIKFNRVNDLGYLLGRIFINKDGHYFMQGKRQYSFLHRDFSRLILNASAVRSIVESAVTQAVEFDLFAPPIDAIQQITLLEKIRATGNIALKTGKRMGFDLDPNEHDSDFSMSVE
ncbi:MAG: hypothetical protein ISR55_02235 [Bacteroidetes bacterium]|nr:hypothetical protein [Bacteroidota bacterium]MBL6962616.1 hypothetical protein [Bacteroidota bacterium]